MRSQRRLVSPLSAVNLAPNTFIGGVAAEIPTKADLATKLAITENDISYFSAIGSDIEARIDTNWILGGKFRYNNITFLYDYDGKIINSLVDLYSNQTIKEIYLPGILGITESGFKYTNQCVLYYLPKAEFFGATTGNENIFVKNGQITKRIYCHPSNSTSNNGGVEGDLQLAIDYGSEVIYVQNYTTPNIITNLSIGTIYATALQINFTPPSSVNDIDYYEVYVNGVFYKEITVSGDYITGLEPDTPYTIIVKAVDIYYNKSEFSNSVSDTTNATEPYPISDIISYYKLEGNALDVNNVNNGTPTGITYEAGLVGQRAIFNGTTSRIILTNNASLQLNQGSIVTIINSTNAGSSYRGIVIKQFAYGLFLNSGVLIAFSWGSATGIAAGEKSTGMNLNDGLNHVIALTFNSGVVNETKVYVDGSLVLTTSIAVSNQTKSLVFGVGTSDSIIQQINAKIDDTAVFNTILTAAEVLEITSKLQSGQSLI